MYAVSVSGCTIPDTFGTVNYGPGLCGCSVSAFDG
jgi:hypothetical protein